MTPRKVSEIQYATGFETLSGFGTIGDWSYSPTRIADETARRNVNRSEWHTPYRVVQRQVMTIIEDWRLVGDVKP